MEYATVRAWREDYVRHWGGGPDDPELEGKLATMRDFCERLGKDPDAIVNECLRDTEGGKRIRAKARRRYVEAIREFESAHKGGRSAGNVIRSFLLHNGIAMSADVLSG